MRRVFGTVLFLVVILCSLAHGSSRTSGRTSGATHAVAASGWQTAAFQQYRNDKYTEALKTMEPHKSDRYAKILTTFVHVQEWVYSQNKAQKAIWKGEYKALTVSVGIQDISHLVAIAEEKDKPQSVKLAKKLLKRAFENIYANEDVPELVTYLASTDPDVSKYSFKTLNRILKNRRKVVKDGGSLREQDIKMMTDKALLSQLTAIIAQQSVNGKEAAAPKSIKHAMKSLVLIEEPSLQYLDQVSGVSVSDAKIDVQKAVAKRRGKYPKSNWHSAIGKAT